MWYMLKRIEFWVFAAVIAAIITGGAWMCGVDIASPWFVCGTAVVSVVVPPLLAMCCMKM